MGDATMAAPGRVALHAWLGATVRGLVDDERAVRVEVFPATDSVTFEVYVARSDFGKLIGKEGAHAESIRTLLKAMSRKHNSKYVLNLIDPDPKRRRHLDGCEG
jgi:predicted RNA-binding protein YlqC (UPF0109 family)